MRQAALLIVVVLAAGCQFNAVGLPPGLSVDGPLRDSSSLPVDLDSTVDAPLDGEVTRPDGAPPKDLTRPPSDAKPPQDVKPPPDTKPPPPDAGPTVVPLSKASLGQAFFAAAVPCVDAANKPQGYNIKIVDSATVSFFNGSVTMAGAPAGTKVWVGGEPTVIVVYNLNACADEYPGDSDWGTAGLLIRKATLSASGQLLLDKSVTVKDINLIDVYSAGAFEGSTDFAKPDDTQLPSLMPQLVNPVGKAKQLIVQLGLN